MSEQDKDAYVIKNDDLDVASKELNNKFCEIMKI